MLQPCVIWGVSNEKCSYLAQRVAFWCMLLKHYSCFCKLHRRDNAQHVPTHCSVPVSNKMSSSKSLYHPLCLWDYAEGLSALSVCVAINVNICHVYLSMYLQEIYVLRLCATDLSSVYSPKKQELLRRPGEAAASSLRNHQHLNSLNVIQLPTLISAQVSLSAG